MYVDSFFMSLSLVRISVRDLQMVVSYELFCIFTTTSRIHRKAIPSKRMTQLPSSLMSRKAALQAKICTAPPQNESRVNYYGSLFSDYITRQKDWEDIIPVKL